MQPYGVELEQVMQRYYATLAEKDRRRYAAIEALKLGRGGQRYIAGLLGCSAKTVSRGLTELKGLPEASPAEPRQRKAGGGGRGDHSAWDLRSAPQSRRSASGA